ncbi:MAG TPA: DUF4175 family protein, partial [Vicinamibacterales bacterium]|nr:DUF4175 family protein [Vicinamibacterales bacterium]
MEKRPGASHELVDVIAKVRKRWRMRQLLTGGVAIVGGGLLAVVLASWGLQYFKFSPASVTTFRVITLALLAGLVVWWGIRPMRRRVTDVQVALYCEEHDPSLQAAILAAVAAQQSTDVPAVIVDRMVEQAIEKAHAIDDGRSVGRTALRRTAAILTALATAAVLTLIIGPEFIRQGASALFVLSKSAEAASPYAITVEPGDVEIPKGSDQSVKARLAGFRSNDVLLMIRPQGETRFEQRPLVPTGDATAFEGMLFDVADELDYYVEADGVRSPTYRMTVVELPAVESLELEYIFPSYTGLPPQQIEFGGDVAAIAGTEVRVRITPTMETPAGRLQLDPGATVELTRQQDGTFTGSFRVEKDGFYRVELDGSRGERVEASPLYTVDVIEDQPPTVSFDKPKRDVAANALEEVFLQARADDDFGVRDLDLVYSVNGGDEARVSLYGRGARPLTEVSGSYTMYLEELTVEPGDFIAYYAQATDNRDVGGGSTTTSDIYFVKVLPFDRDFRRAESQEGGGGGGQQSGVGALSEQQRQIISATFNVERDRSKTPADKFKEDTVFLGLSQARLREEVETIRQQMLQRLEGDEAFRQIAELLPKAIDEMVQAEAELEQGRTKAALAPEQRALKHLQYAEQLYELEVRQQQGGGGGGGGQQMAEELADLFQLELDRMANQYELQQQAQSQATEQQIDELAEKLRELARRQLEQAEQQRRARAQQGGGAGGDGQRALADEIEEMARQLEQLQREAARQGEQRQDLSDAAQRLQQAANSMRQAAATGAQDGGAQAQQAHQRLEEAQRLLEQMQNERASNTVQDAMREAQELVREQQQISADVQGLSQTAGAQREAQTQQLGERKDALGERVGNLERQLQQLGSQALSNNQRETARELQEAARTVREEQIKEIIEWSKMTMGANPQQSRAVENKITGDLQTLSQQVNEAAEAMERDRAGEAGEQALQSTRDLLRGVQSMAEQTGQQGQQG